MRRLVSCSCVVIVAILITRSVAALFFSQFQNRRDSDLDLESIWQLDTLSITLAMRSFLLQGLYAVHVLAGMAVRQTPPYPIHDRQAVSSSGPLVDFQVYEPVLTPSGNSTEYGCVYTKTLMEHRFASSYGVPFVGMGS